MFSGDNNRIPSETMLILNYTVNRHLLHSAFAYNPHNPPVHINSQMGMLDRMI